MKTDCSRCHIGNRVSGHSWCKKCRRQYTIKWRENNPDVVRRDRAKYKKAHGLRCKYGITPAAKAAILAEQENRCAACNIQLNLANNWAFCIDHCHSTKIIRGILCNGCNVSLGFMKENPEHIRKLADYIERFKPKTG